MSRLTRGGSIRHTWSAHGRIHSSSSTAAVDNHPRIDCSVLLSKDPNHPKRPTTLAAMRDALRNRGYFYAANVHAMPASYIANVYDYLYTAHNLPTEVKKLYSPRPYLGFDVGDEHAEYDYEKGTKSSVRSWDYSRSRFTGGSSMYPPVEVLDPPYADFLDELYDRQNELGSALMIGFAEMLGLPRDTFNKHFTSGDLGTIRLLHYPGTTDTEIDRGISAHTDFEAFTLMHQDAPGLQFIPPSGGDWVDAPVRPGEFVVILGDVLERFTNGVLKATPHRVLKTPHSRSSIIRFNAVHEDTLIEPLEAFVSEERPAQYTPVTMKLHMETTMKNLQNGLGAWDSERNVSRTATYQY